MIEVYIDGLAEPQNPGIGTYAFVIYNNGKRLKQGHGFAGYPVTNNHAEYEALARALKELDSSRDQDVMIYSDSKMLVNQMKGEWKAKKGEYLGKHLQAKELALGFPSIDYAWIPREKNSEADSLSRVAYSEYLRGRKRR